MGGRRAATFRIRDREQIRALRSAVRQEIVDALRASGQSSVAELAEMLGRAPDSLYYHLRRLAQVGLVVRRGARRSGRRDEALWDTPAARMIIAGDAAVRTEGLVEVGTAALKVAERDLRKAAAAGLIRDRGKGQNATGGRVKAWLAPAEIEAVRRHMAAVEQIFEGATRDPGDALCAWTWLLTPVPPSGRAPQSPGPKGER